MKKLNCKGIGKAKGFDGCGETSQNRRYGLCQNCLRTWATTTDNGKEWLEQQTAWKMKKEEKSIKKEQRKKDREMKIHLMSTSKYWSEVFQPRFNEVIRLIDNGCGCICTGRTTGKQNAGHYIHAGKNKTLSVNAHNLFLQSFESNHYQSGDVLKFQDGLKNTFGEEYFEFIESLKKCPPLHLSKIELQEAYSKLSKFRKELLEDDKPVFRLPGNRIHLRNRLNYILGLYPDEFSIYAPF